MRAARNPERWQQLEALFQAAIEQPTALRSAFLQQAFGEDVELRQEVEKLLLADASSEKVTLAFDTHFHRRGAEVVQRVNKEKR